MKKRKKRLSDGEMYSAIQDLVARLKRPYDRKSVRAEIERVASQTSSLSYLNIVSTYLNSAIENGDPEAGRLFEEVFHEDFREADEVHLLCAFTFKLEGVHDIPELDMARTEYEWIISGKGRKRTAKSLFEMGLRRIRTIYFHAQCDMPLLIVGETDTSKEATARVIHKMSTRRKGAFRALNCLAFPAPLLGQELFGFRKELSGGKRTVKKGFLEQTDGGTLFLDEVGRMPKDLQAVLLRVIEERTLYRLGDTEPVPVNVRFIAAAQPSNLTDDNLLPDLKYRLGYPDIIKMPTLNDRLQESTDDRYQSVIASSLKTALKKMNLKERMSLNEKCYDILKGYRYKGNYRELENILRAAIISARERKRNEIFLEDLYLLCDTTAPPMPALPERPPVSYEGIRLKDITSHANRIKASVIEAKVREVISSGRDIKSILEQEGLSESEYQMFMRTVKAVTGKGIRELRKQTV